MEIGYRYKEVEPNVVKCLDLNEGNPLPEELSKGTTLYDDDFKKK
jgi:UDP-2-acetamido-3-amino-2,3-dideoxy-glucuronate N-acetyltransferase